MWCGVVGIDVTDKLEVPDFVNIALSLRILLSLH